MSKQQQTPNAQAVAAATAAAAAGGPALAPLSGGSLAAAGSPGHGEAAAGKPVLPPRTPARRRLPLKEQAARAAAQRHSGAPQHRSSVAAPSNSRLTPGEQPAQPSAFTGEYELQVEDEAAPYTGEHAFEEGGSSDSSIDMTGAPARSGRPHSKRRASGPAAPADAGRWTEDGWFVPPPASSAHPSRKRRTSGRADFPPLTRFLSPSKPSSD